MANLPTQPNKDPRDTEGSSFAQVSFRVRCEKIGYGEGVFISQADDPVLANQVRGEVNIFLLFLLSWF